MSKLRANSDEVLISMLKDGDRSAVAELYDRYWKILLAKAFDRLKSREDAEEIVQELFIKIWRRRQTIELQFSFKTYIFAALRYDILHYIAKHKHRKGDISLDTTDDLQFSVQEEEFHSLEMKELQQQISLVIDSLPEKCQIIFKMSRNDGMSAKKIADQLNLSPRTVETQIGKAIRVLRKSFKGSDPYIIFAICELMRQK